ncbi:hypothetical protein [Streptomyces sp. NPDC085540]|uniref:hypothetical protein n=1 Tax=Streptomyces sp. NPDC085540 TaxID=3365730 RepID=UPI0037D1270E
MDAHDRDHRVPRRSGRDFHHQALARAPVRLTVRGAGFGGRAGCSEEEGDLRCQRRGELMGTGSPAAWQSDDEVTGAACNAGEADNVGIDGLGVPYLLPHSRWPPRYMDISLLATTPSIP